MGVTEAKNVEIRTMSVAMEKKLEPQLRQYLHVMSYAPTTFNIVQNISNFQPDTANSFHLYSRDGCQFRNKPRYRFFINNIINMRLSNRISLSNASTFTSYKFWTRNKTTTRRGIRENRALLNYNCNFFRNSILVRGVLGITSTCLDNNALHLGIMLTRYLCK